MTVTFPIDFVAIRKALADQMTATTALVAFLEEPETQNDPRPPLPYVGFKIITPAAKFGDDSKDYDSNTGLWNSGGVRMMTVGFDVYGNTQEEAYSYMCLLQASFDLEDVQENLREAVGIGICEIGGVADLSQLLNTGFEARAHLEVKFSVASNIQSDLGEIDSVTVQGTVSTDSGTGTISVTVQEP